MGLIRGMARTAVIAGTATAVSNNVSRRQQRRWGAQQPVAVPPAAAGDDLTAGLDRLTAMRDRGELSAEEYAAAKAKLLGL